MAIEIKLKNEYRVRERMYRVEIPDMLSQSDNFIRNVGIPYHTDPRIMEHYKRRYIETMLTPVMMASYLANNIDVRFLDRSKIMVIYTDIQLYLAEWEEVVSRSPNLSRNVKMDHVIELDNFAKRIHTKLTQAELQAAEVNAVKKALGDNVVKRSRPEDHSADPVQEKGEYVTLEQLQREKDRERLRGRRG